MFRELQGHYVGFLMSEYWAIKSSQFFHLFLNILALSLSAGELGQVTKFF